MNRRTFSRASWTAALCLTLRARGAEPAPGPLSDEEILATCKTGIETHRKGRATIAVRDQAGHPLTGATITVEQLSHDFLFGCNFFMFDRCGSPEREEPYRERFANLFNYATLGFYWASFEHTRSRPNYEYARKAATWCRDHGIRCKGHPLVWEHEAGSPAWLPDDETEISRLSHERVREIITRFRGTIDMWDVVNEATHVPGNPNKTKMGAWAQKLGPVDYVASHLATARAANPAATLLVNDYKLEPAYLRILEAQRKDGKPTFDAVGLQSHMHGGLWPLARLQHHCDTYAKLGLPLHFTEATLVSGPRSKDGKGWAPSTPEGEDRQAGQAVKFYTTLFAHPAMRAITWWDFSDHGAWQGAAAGFLRKDMSPKPVYDRLHALIKSEWWTKATGQTNEQGLFPLHAFHGKHRVTIALPNGRRSNHEIELQPGGKSRFDLTA